MKHIDSYNEPTTNSKASQNCTRQIFIQGSEAPTANLPHKATLPNHPHKATLTNTILPLMWKLKRITNTTLPLMWKLKRILQQIIHLNNVEFFRNEICPLSIYFYCITWTMKADNNSSLVIFTNFLSHIQNNKSISNTPAS